MADLGLLGGIGEGLKAGLAAYQDQSRYNDQLRQKQIQEALQQKLLQADLMSKGLQEAPEGGGLVYSPNKLQQMEYEQSGYDPNSERSKRTASSYRGLLGAVNPKLAAAIPEGVPAKELADENSIYGKALSGEYNVRGQQARGQGLEDLGQQRIDLRKQQQAQQVGKQIDNALRPMIAFEGRADNAEKILHQDVVTPQAINEVQTVIAGLINGGKGATTEGSIHRIEMNTLEQDFANLKQKLMSEPQNVNAPETKQYLLEMLHKLRQTNDNIKENLLESQAAGSEVYGNQYIDKLVDAKRKYYVKPKAEGLLQNQAAGAQLKAPPAGYVRITNGSETINIPSSDLNDAIKEGYKQVQ